MNTLNKKRNLSTPKADKNCHHIKPFKKLFNPKFVLGIIQCKFCRRPPLAGLNPIVPTIRRNVAALRADFALAKSRFKNVINIGCSRNGQVFIEYTVLIVCVVLALLAMQVYLKRGIQGKLRDSADQIGSQYEPGKTKSDFTISSKSSISTVSTLTIDKEAKTTNAETIVTTNYDEQTRKGSETVGAF